MDKIIVVYNCTHLLPNLGQSELFKKIREFCTNSHKENATTPAVCAAILHCWKDKQLTALQIVYKL